MKLKSLVAALFIAVILTPTANGQDLRYQGDVEVGYRVGKLLGFAYNTASINTSQGVRINDYLYTGIGLGLDIAHSPEVDGIDVFIPIGLNVIGYYPISETIQPFIYTDLGYGIYAMSGLNGGFNFGIGAGVELSMFRISLGHGRQSATSEGVTIGQNGFDIKLGIVF